MFRTIKVALLAVLFFAGSAFATAHLNVTFLDSEGGAAYTFDKVIISDGDQVQIFQNVTNVSADVPEDFTLTTVYHVGSHSNMFEIPLTLDPGETLNLEVYGVGPDTVYGRIRPYLVGKEVGTLVDLTWNYSEGNHTLTYSVGTNPPHRPAIVANWVQTARDFIDDIYWITVSVEINGLVWSYKWCINGADILDTPLHYRQTHHFIHINKRQDIPREMVRSTFSQVSGNMRSLGIRRANHNYARVITDYVLTLRNLNGQDYPPVNFYPQWEIPPQTHYILGITGMPVDFVPLEYPLFVPDTVHSSVSDLYPPKLAELVPDTFFVAAENFFANSSYSNLVRVPGVSMSVDVATEKAFDWWGCFVLPDAYTVGHLYAYPGGIELAQNTDYLVNPAQGYNLVTVRTSPSYEKLVLDYAPVALAGVEENARGLEILFDQHDGTTQIRYLLPQNAQVELAVYSTDGRKVTTLIQGYKPAGSYTVSWNGTDAKGAKVPSGVYICKLSVDGLQATQKMLRLE